MRISGRKSFYNKKQKKKSLQHLLFVVDKIILLFMLGFLLGSLFLVQRDKTEMGIYNSQIPAELKNVSFNVNERISSTTPFKKEGELIPSSVVPTIQTAKVVSLPQVPVLMYHYIGDYYLEEPPRKDKELMRGLAVQIAEFEKQMKYLSESGYNSINLTNLIASKAGKFKIPKKPIVITFDDGYKDFYTNALPILKKYKLKSEVFLISDFIDRENYLTMSMVKELKDSGIVKLGSISLDHKALPQMTKEAIVKELILSKTNLENYFGSIGEFAYPYGMYDDTVLQETKNAGYKLAVTTKMDRWDPATDNFLIPRIRVSGYFGIEQFKLLV